MRSNRLSLLLLTLCTTAAPALAQKLSLPDTPGVDLRDNPDCALPCLSAGLNQTSCPTTDQACLCRDEDFLARVEHCIVLSCPLKYALQSQNITWKACAFPLHNEVGKTRIARIVLFVLLACLSIILRTVTKYARLSSWGPDDYTIFAAYVLLVGYTSLHAYIEGHGAGRDLWTLTESQIDIYFKILYALRIFYHSCIDMIKASILFSYLRIFHLPDEKIRTALWVTMIINLLTGLIFVFVGVFQCQPITLAWTFWTGEAKGKCVNIVYVSLAHAGINITLDLWILILPATQIWGMNLARRKKFAVMAMFSLGLFLTVVTAVRIPAILDFRNYPLNPTVAMMPVVVWSDIELNVGIFTACIPNLRQFFVRFILGRSEKKRRLASVISGHSDSRSMPRSQGLTQAQQFNELNTVESNLAPPDQKSIANV
ncbi:hypothetical protein LX36DRAFT_713996 [Colletotrichum falcatum]|nr:hypothetical protein LX36DRAFT_713996 [Colletotrichum falcatum]